jgi:hypothetical protein
MVFRRRLHVPHVARVPVQVAGLDGIGDRVLVADRAACGVDEPRALLEVLEQVRVHEPARALVQGAVDRDDVALRDKVLAEGRSVFSADPFPNEVGRAHLEVVDAARVDLLRGVLGQRVVVVVQQLLAVERHEALEHAEADAARAERADDLALEVERVARDLGDLPVAALDHLVRGHEVADEEEDRHDDVLRDGDDVRARHLHHLDVPLHRRIEVDVVRADTGSDAHLQVLRL